MYSSSWPHNCYTIARHMLDQISRAGAEQLCSSLGPKIVTQLPGTCSTKLAERCRAVVWQLWAQSCYTIPRNLLDQIGRAGAEQLYSSLGPRIAIQLLGTRSTLGGRANVGQFGCRHPFLLAHIHSHISFTFIHAWPVTIGRWHPGISCPTLIRTSCLSCLGLVIGQWQVVH